MSCPSCQAFFDLNAKTPCKFDCGHDICKMCAINPNYQGQPCCKKCQSSQQFTENQKMIDRIKAVTGGQNPPKNQNELQCESHQATNNNICIDCHEVLCDLCQKQHNEHTIKPKEQALSFYQTEFFKQPQNIINEQKIQVAQRLSQDYQNIINKLQQQHDELQQQLSTIQNQLLQQAEQQFQSYLYPLNQQIQDRQNELQLKMQNAWNAIQLALEVQNSMNTMPQNNTDVLLKFAQAFDACQKIQETQDTGFKIPEITIDEQMLNQLQQSLENCVEFQVKDLIVEDLKARIVQAQQAQQAQQVQQAQQAQQVQQAQEAQQVQQDQQVKQIIQEVQKINIQADMLLQNDIKEQEIGLFEEAMNLIMQKIPGQKVEIAKLIDCFKACNKNPQESANKYLNP